MTQILLSKMKRDVLQATVGLILLTILSHTKPKPPIRKKNEIKIVSPLLKTYGLVLPGHQLGKPSDVRLNMSTQKGSFCIYYTPNPKISFNY